MALDSEILEERIDPGRDRGEDRAAGADAEAMIVEIAQNHPVRLTPVITKTPFHDRLDGPRLSLPQDTRIIAPVTGIAHRFQMTDEQGQVPVTKIDGNLQAIAVEHPVVPGDAEARTAPRRRHRVPRKSPRDANAP